MSGVWWCGLVPSEYSSGPKRTQGEITKTGNSHARRVLVEAAWNYRFPARMSAILQRRQEGQPKAVRQIVNAEVKLDHVCNLRPPLTGDWVRPYRYPSHEPQRRRNPSVSTPASPLFRR